MRSQQQFGSIFHRRRTDHFQENQEDGPDIFNNVDGSDDLPPKDVTPPNIKLMIMIPIKGFFIY
ncbi:hypothetical protein Q757_09255 [Oenococcus alcoholitolerans]|uniref:Uncharacterized protein n=1 Tax=Oenococcus alcoholitolerans TaxID=931074 RepID=A0ABR4XNW6_9LACO|nr:hypothetical protein Q757_09255 [Oenococcus alcoholitolerans]